MLSFAIATDDGCVVQCRTGCAKREEDIHSGCEGPTAAAISGADSGGGVREACDGRSRMTVAFAWITRFSEGGPIESLSSREPAFVLPSAVCCSGAEVGRGREPGETVAKIVR
jgi:hypothetical protein